MPTLQFRFLGPLDIRWDGQPLPTPATRKAQSLLAYLVMNRSRPQPRDRLVDLFWGEQPEHKARRSLATALWHVRRCLPAEGFIRSDVYTVQFVAQGDLWLDVEECESALGAKDLPTLQRGITLYRGDFLDGFYDDWVINERYRLQSLFLEGLSRLIAGYEAVGNHQAALATALRLLEYDPLREDAHRAAMRAYCQLGQRNAALQQYTRCRAIVQEELGAEPTAETTELYHRILDGRHPVAIITDNDQITAPTPVPTAPSTYGPPEIAAPTRLAGRDNELAFLLESWQTATEGKGSLVLIEGEAGVGKTRLVQELANRLHWQGVRVLWGRCYEFERHLPYQPIAEALRSILPTMSAAELERFPVWVLAEISRLVPELAERRPGIPLPTKIGLDEERAHLFDGVARFMAGLSTHEAVLVILDDLHWATDSTFQLLHYLVRQISRCRVLIVGTFRAESVGPGHPLNPLVQVLSQEGFCKLLRLACLPAAAVQALIVEMSHAGDAVVPLAKRLYEETEGNPFFLIEIIRALFETGVLYYAENGVWSGDFAQLSCGQLPLPVSVSEAVQVRMHRLSKATQEALHVAAVAGVEFDFDVLRAASQYSTEEILQALDDLLRCRLIEERADAFSRDYAFAHQVIQSVIYDDLPLRRRQYLHALVGQAMEYVYRGEIEELAGELAFHFQHGRLVAPELAEKAIRYLLQAGDRARLLGAHDEALGFYHRALPLLEELDLPDLAARTWMKTGLVHHNAFQFREARRAYEEGFTVWKKVQAQKSARPGGAPHALRVAWWDPTTLDPALSGESASGGVIDQLFCGLVELSADMEILPAMAESWEVLDEGRRYVFHLREDAQWSNGHAVTAHDFEFAWKRALDPKTGAPLASALYDIEGAKAYHEGAISDPAQLGVQALNDSTLSVELAEPAGYFLQVLAFPVAYAVPRFVVQQHGTVWTDLAHLVVNGPFQIKAWKPGESMKLVRNPAYSGRSGGNVQHVELCLHGKDTAKILYEAHELDFFDLRGLAPAELDRLRQLHAEDYISAPCPTTWYLAFNTRRSPFDDMRVRQALALAIDKERLVNVATGGIHSPASGGLVPPAVPGHSSGIALPYQLERAQQLLTEAGYPGGSGFPSQELQCAAYPRTEPLARELQRQWQENLDISISFELLTLPTFMQKVEKESCHVFLSGWMADYPDPDSFLRVCLQWQGAGWQNEAYSALVEKARNAPQAVERLRLFGEAERMLISEAAIIPLTHERLHLLVKPWVKLPLSPFRWWFWKDAIIAAH